LKIAKGNNRDGSDYSAKKTRTVPCFPNSTADDAWSGLAVEGIYLFQTYSRFCEESTM
jgi:hypothetical protein